MIERMELYRFKRFHSLSLVMRPLTVLTGTNGSGKTSIIHALLLSHLATQSRSAVKLNGPFGLQLGEAVDVLYQGAEAPDIQIHLHLDTGVRVWKFGVNDEKRRLHLECLELPESPADPIGLSGPKFTYLCAERLGPRQHLPVDAGADEEMGVGSQGEYVAHVLAMNDSRKIAEARRLPGLESLKHQTEAWAARIVHALRIEARWPEGSTLSELRFETGFGHRVHPPNMGFGVSYALPIIVAGLTVPSGGLLIVENPEAHLHPAGQSQIGRFLAQMAGDGVQVVVETHSDHVLNGIRKAIAEQEIELKSDACVIHFFDYQVEGARQLEVKADGTLSAWPPRFFDQSEKDLGDLARLRKRPVRP